MSISCADEKTEHQIRGNGHDGVAQEDDDAQNGQHGDGGFPDFFADNQMFFVKNGWNDDSGLLSCENAAINNLL